MHKKVMINYTDETDAEKFKKLITDQFELICIPLLKKTTLKVHSICFFSLETNYALSWLLVVGIKNYI